MKGILKKIGTAFVETVDEAPIKKPPAPISALNVVESVGSPTGGTIPSEEYVAFCDKFAKILEEENKRNYPGNDYYEFIVMKNAMNAIPQESLRYQAAYAGWSTGGNQTKKSLLDTAKVYLGLVDREISEFEEAYKHQYTEKVTKNEEIINQKSERVQKLVQEINDLNAEINTLKKENIDATAKLTTKHSSFMEAGRTKRQEIMDEMDKINNYIN